MQVCCWKYCDTSWAVAGTFGLWLVHAQFLSLSSCTSTVPDIGRVQPFPIPLHRAIHNDASNDRITVSQNIYDLEGTHKDHLVIFFLQAYFAFSEGNTTLSVPYVFSGY